MAIFWQGPDCGSHTRWELTNWADFQLCLRRLLVSTGCKSRHNGFLDVSCSNGGLKISGWIGQLSCLTIFSTRLSVAAFLRRAGGSMLESTGSHGRGVEQRVPEMSYNWIRSKNKLQAKKQTWVRFVFAVPYSKQDVTTYCGVPALILYLSILL